MNVPVRSNGELEFSEGKSKPGSYVELEALRDLIVIISCCPQLNNPCNDFIPTPLQILIFDQ
jgi:uncharacterized protein YcgI (DUF1989 family)